MFKTLGLYLLAPAAILAMLALNQTSSTSHQEEEMKALKGEIRSSPSSSPRSKAQVTAANIACVGAAVNAREAALGSGIAAYTVGVQSAYSARAVALQAAYATTETTKIRAAVKAAWTAFGTSTKTASKTWKTAQKAAWTGFATAAKACKASEVPSDTANASAETKGE